MAAKRMKLLLKNYLEAKKEGAKEGFDIQLVDPDDLEHYYILLKPNTGIYRDQYHILEMRTSYGSNIKYEYPIKAPSIKFLTHIYHVNISTGGSICLDILKEENKWMPSYSFTQVMFNLMLLYQHPNNSSPFNGSASRDHVKCGKDFKQRKSRGMTVEEETSLEEECFSSFKAASDKYADKNSGALKKFAKWFPQLVGKERPSEELAELEAMYESVCVKKTKAKKEKKPKKARWARHKKT